MGLAPRAPEIARDVKIGPVIVESVAIDRDVRDARVEVRSLDARHVAPRREHRRRNVAPVRAGILANVDQTVVATRP